MLICSAYLRCYKTWSNSTSWNVFPVSGNKLDIDGVAHSVSSQLALRKVLKLTFRRYFKPDFFRKCVREWKEISWCALYPHRPNALIVHISKTRYYVVVARSAERNEHCHSSALTLCPCVDDAHFLSSTLSCCTTHCTERTDNSR